MKDNNFSIKICFRFVRYFVNYKRRKYLNSGKMWKTNFFLNEIVKSKRSMKNYGKNWEKHAKRAIMTMIYASHIWFDINIDVIFINCNLNEKHKLEAFVVLIINDTVEFQCWDRKAFSALFSKKVKSITITESCELKVQSLRVIRQAIVYWSFLRSHFNNKYNSTWLTLKEFAQFCLNNK